MVSKARDSSDSVYTRFTRSATSIVHIVIEDTQ